MDKRTTEKNVSADSNKRCIQKSLTNRLDRFFMRALMLACAMLVCMTGCTDKNEIAENRGDETFYEYANQEKENTVANQGDGRDCFSESIISHVHTYTEEVVAPSCKEDGYTVHICECGDTYRDFEVEALGHAYDEGTVLKATCTEDGYTEFVCATCGDSKKESEVEALGHTYEDTVVDATCSAKGYTEHKCSVCGDTYQDAETEKLDHQYKSKKVKATCEDKGYIKYECKVCGDTYKDSYTDATGHEFAENDVAPSCAEEGYTLHKCKKCDKSYKDNPVPKSEHTIAEKEVAPTCIEKGHTLHYCETCNYSYKDAEIEIVDHNYVKQVIDPTTESIGYTKYTCDMCGDYYVDEESVVPALPKDIKTSDVEVAFLKYINQWRSSPLTRLSGMSKVAKYRSKQLVSNFNHSTSEMREALAHYEYGRYVDMSEFGGDASQNHYEYDGREAIGYTRAEGYEWESADEIGHELATACRNSSGHWSYVGSSKYPYCGIGVTKSGDYWFISIMVGTVNYG